MPPVQSKCKTTALKTIPKKIEMDSTCIISQLLTLFFAGLITIIAMSVGLGLLFSLLGVAKITNRLEQQRARKLRQKIFRINKGLLFNS